ncbi:unnamed protein product [Closterium sp. NIES-53]
MTTLRVLLHVAAQRDYELHSQHSFFAGQPARGDLAAPPTWLHWVISCKYLVEPPAASLRSPPGASRVAQHTEDYTCGSWVCSFDFRPEAVSKHQHLAAAILRPSVQLQKRHICTDLGELRSYLRLQITQDRARRTITLTQSHMMHQVLHRFGFRYSSLESNPLPTGYSLSAPPSHESVVPRGPYPELVGCLMYPMTCSRPDLAYPLSILARYVAPGRHRPQHREATKRVLRYLCSTSGMGIVLGGRGPVVLTGQADTSWVDDLATQRSCEAEIYAGAMAAQELRWLAYMLTDVGEWPHSSLVLYVDNKAMIQRGQLRLAYVATRANTADIFTKALQSGNHEPYFAFLDWSGDHLFSPTLPMGVCQTHI